MSELLAHETGIPGLIKVDLVLNGDGRGWFKENWNQSALRDLGLPDFNPVQNNISYNKERGVTRGIHAEPWNKFISLGFGEVFAAIVDFREGSTFGNVETLRLTPGEAIYVPEGCGNSFQTLEDNTVYTYLVDEHWSPEAKYTMLNLADPKVAIEWPIPLEEAIVSDKDKSHPYFKDLKPMEI